MSTTRQIQEMIDEIKTDLHRLECTIEQMDQEVRSIFNELGENMEGKNEKEQLLNKNS